MRIESLSDVLREKLRQVNEQGMAQAAEMLSRLLRQPVKVDVPGALNEEQLQLEQQPGEPGLAISMDVSGELQGGMLLFFTQASADWLSSQLLGHDEFLSLLSEPASSTLREVGNIIASAFLASLDNQLGLRALPSPPELSIKPLSELFADQQQVQVVPCPIVCSRLSGEEGTESLLQGAIYLFPESRSLELLAERLS